jgi:hypothetical protein
MGVPITKTKLYQYIIYCSFQPTNAAGMVTFPMKNSQKDIMITRFEAIYPGPAGGGIHNAAQSVGPGREIVTENVPGCRPAKSPRLIARGHS